MNTQEAEIQTESCVDICLPRALPGRGLLSYAAPEGKTLLPGSVVKVPLGAKTLTGMVRRTTTPPQGITLKPVIRQLPVPPFSEPFMEFLEWVAAYTLSPLGAVLKLVLSSPKALLPLPGVAGYSACEPLPGVKLTGQRRAVLEFLRRNGAASKAQIREHLGVSAAVLSAMERAQLLTPETLPQEEEAEPKPVPVPVTLSEAQHKAATQLKAAVRAKEFSVTLLDGVTGSGKTEVYLDAIEEALQEEGAQALVLLPEIVLTAPMVERFRARLGFEPLLWHSEVSQARKATTWRKVAEGKAKLVVGARSALFLPFKKLRVLVVDEEHDASYKQEDGVIYHARDMAVARAHKEQFPVILCSATPSLETMVNVEQGKYQQVVLPLRHGGAALPEVKTIDLRAETMPASEWISPTLRAALAVTLAEGRQSLLFLNRRGYAPLTLCRHCGYRFACADCSAWMVEHKREGRLICHHCGTHRPLPKTCPECGTEGKLAACGPGIERLAEEVAGFLPKARLMLLASDLLSSQKAAEEAVAKIARKEVDIIIGTQIIAKGHHFPSLTLVGVVDADLGLAGGDLRAGERTFQLLHQVAGRAGRAEHAGVVFLQTAMPENNVMQALIAHDRDTFLALESESRRRCHMPPFSRLAAVVVTGRAEEEVARAARQIAGRIPAQEAVEVLGPAPAAMARLKGQYRYRLLIKAPRSLAIQKQIAAALAACQLPSRLQVKVDIDPYGFM